MALVEIQNAKGCAKKAFNGFIYRRSILIKKRLSKQHGDAPKVICYDLTIKTFSKDFAF